MNKNTHYIWCEMDSPSSQFYNVQFVQFLNQNLRFYELGQQLNRI